MESNGKTKELTSDTTEEKTDLWESGTDRLKIGKTAAETVVKRSKR